MRAALAGVEVKRGQGGGGPPWETIAIHGLLTPGILAAAGVSREVARWALGSGELHRIWNGVYVPRTIWDAADAAARHRLLVLAAQRRGPARVAVAESAATLLDLPLPHGPPSEPHLAVRRTTTRSGVPRHPNGMVGSRLWLAEQEVWTLADGVRVTSAARTVVDCARHLSRPWSLAVGDAAQRRWAVSGPLIQDAADQHSFAPGHPAAVWVARHATPLAESPLESLARAVIILAELPVPTPQAWVRTRLGRFRVDLMIEEFDVVVEVDGRLKYATAEDLWREKRREDALRDAGCEVVRFTIEDYRRAQSWLARYRNALRRAARRRSLEFGG